MSMSKKPNEGPQGGEVAEDGASGEAGGAPRRVVRCKERVELELGGSTLSIVLAAEDSGTARELVRGARERLAALVAFYSPLVAPDEDQPSTIPGEAS